MIMFTALGSDDNRSLDLPGENELYGFLDSEPVSICDGFAMCLEDISTLIPQESEVSEIRWFDLDKVWDEIKTDRGRFCVPAGELNVLREESGFV